VNYNFRCRTAWAKILISHSEGRTQTENENEALRRVFGHKVEELTGE